MRITHRIASPFGNTYGSLSMVTSESGEQFLIMEDAFNDDVFGPLTEEQLAAFNVLLNVQECKA